LNCTDTRIIFLTQPGGNSVAPEAILRLNMVNKSERNDLPGCGPIYLIVDPPGVPQISFCGASDSFPLTRQSLFLRACGDNLADRSRVWEEDGSNRRRVIPGFFAAGFLRFYTSINKRTAENHAWGSNGIRFAGPGILYSSPLSPGEFLGRRKHRRRHSLDLNGNAPLPTMRGKWW